MKSSASSRQALQASTSRNPVELQLRFDGPFRSVTNFDVSPDEEHFLMLEYEPSPRPRIHVLMNWQ